GYQMLGNLILETITNPQTDIILFTLHLHMFSDSPHEMVFYQPVPKSLIQNLLQKSLRSLSQKSLSVVLAPMKLLGIPSLLVTRTQDLTKVRHITTLDMTANKIKIKENPLLAILILFELFYIKSVSIVTEPPLTESKSLHYSSCNSNKKVLTSEVLI
ncbi:hypothetical protein L9F63_018592, partial [Diploptera punctata]